MTAEIWKDVKGYEGFYKVSNYGDISRCCNGIRAIASGYKWRYEV